MIRSLKAAAVLSGALTFGVFLGAMSSPSRAYAEAEQVPARRSEMQQPVDPKKKNPGDACKNSSECQKHHTCVKVDDKSVCQAPPRPRLPPGAVT